MNQDIALDDLVGQYADWIKENSSIHTVENWKSVTVPLLDHAGDYFQFYVRSNNGHYEFDDDGFTLATMESSGFTESASRMERINETAHQFGADFVAGSLKMRAKPDKVGDAMNRYVQALIHLDSLMETVGHRIATYFAEDVATALKEQHIHFTSDVNIQGKSLYSHNFDFLFQESDRRPTLFAKAPNRLDTTSLATILFAWEDVSGAKEREDAGLLVFADDREKPVNGNVLTAFEQYNAQIMRFSEIDGKGAQLLAA
ncbi:DUF1829 domain-containing protein [Bifidobacterium bombi]|uniref:DUF1828 domain-containing protein n=1 Tax=Bifidobacterium bombi DSM 19703 TaxID=1341695 RepID=A0A086BND8_9BIFI|nr:DUF1829 domain-containing protein [Bifidobacterium bombi]KFF30452.1 hypothetical protein BBOMB_1580 [Bifidobacterium bombi DSM 19703]